MFLTLLQNEFAAERVGKHSAHKTEGKKLMQHEYIAKWKIFSLPFILGILYFPLLAMWTYPSLQCTIRIKAAFSKEFR